MLFRDECATSEFAQKRNSSADGRIIKVSFAQIHNFDIYSSECARGAKKKVIIDGQPSVNLEEAERKKVPRPKYFHHLLRADKPTGCAGVNHSTVDNLIKRRVLTRSAPRADIINDF
jgi:hypothetical protein